MGFSAKQVKALRRNLDHRYVRTREANGRELFYIEGWYAISVQQLEAMPRDLAVVKRGVEQLTEKQEQMARNSALRSAEYDIKKKTSSPHLQTRTKLLPWPETKPTTIAGWTLRGITNGTAVLEGPHGTWRAMRGDTVPGVGRVESMVRWGGRLIVATSSGLISTP